LEQIEYLEQRVDDLIEQKLDMMEVMDEQRVSIAYRDGILDGLGHKKTPIGNEESKVSKNADTLCHPSDAPEPVKKKYYKLVEDGLDPIIFCENGIYTIAIPKSQNEMDKEFLDGIGDDCCPDCDVEADKKKNLIEVSGKIQKWAEENDVKVGKGDIDDN
jgi:hypothetical protein